ncbi:helix-turn-helix domain-containing protein [Nocardia sp. NPDC004168]|uniref:TetR/AcrR family transcriptional regulator n=1 Tax=Nocardia sp. NPDC004168 TaxID=3154452 RepID=UPI0033AC3AEA
MVIKTRMTATERGEQVLRAAVTAFAESGYAATGTDEIARRAGVSQPYVIRLFGTKQNLFRAALHRAFDRIEGIFNCARAAAAPDANIHEALAALADGYSVFLAERELPQLLLHGFAASANTEIGEQARVRFGGIYQLTLELTGASKSEANRFLATGMLLAVMSAMSVAGPDAVPVSWAREILDDLRMFHE